MRQAEQPRSAPPERRIIERPRLLKQLEETDAKTILLIAPAGYGKTTLARQWARGRSAAWYAANLGSADVAALARGLAQSLAQIAPQLPRMMDESLHVMRTPAKEISGLTEVFASRLREKGDLWLVIDDYQALATSVAGEQLVAALAASDTVHTLIASRTRPSWATARGLIYGETIELGRRELGFDALETTQLIGERSISSEMIERAKGWPAVLSLVAFAGEPNAPPTEEISEELYDYLAQETFSGASPAMQDVLLSLALLPSLSAETLTEVFGPDWASTTADAARTGLIECSRHGVELHPLARTFLFERLRATPGVDTRVRAAVTRAVDAEAWDEAFALVESFHVDDALNELMTRAFSPLLAMGRVETLERFGRYAAERQVATTPIVELIEAEIAFRDGRLAEAQAIGVAAADRFSRTHQLKARGYNLAGAAALVRFDLLAESHRLHSLALECANSAQDERDARWGQCLALIYLEDDSSADAAEELARISDAAPEDRIRAATAQLLVKRQRHGFHNFERLLIAHKEFEKARDPRARTSFGNVFGYILGLQARYDEAAAVVDASLADAETYNLSFAKPHLRWTKAFIALGQRRFSDAHDELRAVEGTVDAARSDHIDLNVRTLRSRMLTVQHRAQEAVEVTSARWTEFPTHAMYGEYLGSRALALAVVGDRTAMRKTIVEAVQLTSVVEVQTLAATASAIASLSARNARRKAQDALDVALLLNTWDALVCGVRSAPKLLEILATNPANRRTLVAVLRRSRDDSLLRAFGLSKEWTYGRAGLLSRREREVADLIRQGLKNREIAQMLFISEATAKVHVRHVLEKLGARSRAEAVALYALTNESETPRSSGDSAAH